MTTAAKRDSVTHIPSTIREIHERLDMMRNQPTASLSALLARMAVPVQDSFSPCALLCSTVFRESPRSLIPLAPLWANEVRQEAVAVFAVSTTLLLLLLPKHLYRFGRMVI